MAEGIRIRHHTRRSQMLPVPLLHQPRLNVAAYPECGRCRVVHPCKVVHVDLDAEGTAIVSESVWAQFQRVPNWAGFRVVNTVSNPPTQGVGLDAIRVASIIDGVDVGGILALEDGKNRVQFDMGGNGKGGTVEKAEVDLRTVTIEQYFELMARHGYGTERAGQILIQAIWRDGPQTKGAQ
jgi:hypothetical protein